MESASMTHVFCPTCSHKFDLANNILDGVTQCPNCHLSLNVKENVIPGHKPEFFYDAKPDVTQSPVPLSGPKPPGSTPSPAPSSRKKTTNLIHCPDCDKEVSNKAAACIHCGCPLKAPQRKPLGSVGECPACGSLNTIDRIADVRKRDGFFGSLGARIGSRISGHGRYGCKDCRHTWEFGQNI